MRRALILMAKQPIPGNSKTRLIPKLTAEEAAELYECFLLDLIARLQDCAPFTLVIALDQLESTAYFDEVAPGVEQILQEGPALGDRLNSVLGGCLTRGFDEAYAIGSDSPDLPDNYLTDAVDCLADEDTDVVFGPSEDGGYYLIGWKKPWPSIVTDVTMSTPTVLADTLEIAGELGARVQLGPEWYDIDEPSDLDRLRGALTLELAPRTFAFISKLSPG